MVGWQFISCTDSFPATVGNAGKWEPDSSVSFWGIVLKGRLIQSRDWQLFIILVALPHRVDQFDTKRFSTKYLHRTSSRLSGITEQSHLSLPSVCSGNTTSANSLSAANNTTNLFSSNISAGKWFSRLLEGPGSLGDLGVCWLCSFTSGYTVPLGLGSLLLWSVYNSIGSSTEERLIFLQCRTRMEDMILEGNCKSVLRVIRQHEVDFLILDWRAAFTLLL